MFRIIRLLDLRIDKIEVINFLKPYSEKKTERVIKSPNVLFSPAIL